MSHLPPSPADIGIRLAEGEKPSNAHVILPLDIVVRGSTAPDGANVAESTP